MSNFYAEGVDLKVAEKYRVPPRIPVPRDVIAHVSGDHYKQLTSDPETDYNFNLERSVIQKIEEWKRVHDQTEHVRQEQLRARDRERRQFIEQEQKHLLNQVSYPSTADLSSDGESEGKDGESSGATPTTKVTAPAAVIVPVTSAHRLQNDFFTILQPTVVPESTMSSGRGVGKSVDSSSSSNYSRNSNNNNFYKGHNGGKDSSVADINYSEWESDNYSPFDRMELKSINDLDILAQVLQTTQLNRTSPAAAAPDNKDQTPPEDVPLPPGSPPSSPVEVVTSPVEVVPQPASISIQSEAVQESVVLPDDMAAHINYSWNNHIPTTVGTVPQLNGPTDSINNNITFPTYQPTTTQAPSSHQDYGQPHGYYGHHQYNSSIPSYNYQPQYSANYHQQTYPTNSQLDHHSMATTNHSAGQYNGQSDRIPEEPKTNSLLRSRSKSVPDIVNELEEEVKASEQRRRVRNHSQSYKVPDDEEEEDDDCGASGESAFERLPEESKELALKISKMGFPLDVVATVIEQLGNDDKKVGRLRETQLYIY